MMAVFMMTSLPLTNCSTFLSLQWGMFDHQWYAVESVVWQDRILRSPSRCL